jgi:hypothetical protein
VVGLPVNLDGKTPIAIQQREVEKVLLFAVLRKSSHPGLIQRAVQDLLPL